MQRVKLNLVPDGISPVIYLSRNDVGRQYSLDIYDGDSAYEIPSNAVITLHGSKPDHHVFAYKSDSDTSNVTVSSASTITVTSTLQMTAIDGVTHCELLIKNGDSELGTLNYDMLIEPSAIPSDDQTSVSDLMAYEEMRGDCRDAQKKGETARDETLEARDEVVKARNEVLSQLQDFGTFAPVTRDVTLDSTSWSDDTYTIADSLVTETSIQEVSPAIGITMAQYKAFCNACIVDGGQEAGSLKLKALKGAPNIDIPIRVTYMGGSNTSAN